MTIVNQQGSVLVGRDRLMACGRPILRQLRQNSDMLTLALLALALVGAPQDPAAPQAPAAGTLPVSVNRIREALQKPQVIDVRLPEPTYHVEVRGHPFFTERPWTWDFRGGGVPMTGPRAGRSSTLVGVDVLPFLARARKARAQRAAE